MTLAISVLLVVAVVVYVVGIRARDLPEADPPSPTAHLEERRARIFEGLRDLQFEYRVGKLSDDDYNRTKTGLQAELAQVLAAIEQITGPPAPAPTSPPPPPAPVRDCPHCGARFEKPMKFCGECGKPMETSA